MEICSAVATGNAEASIGEKKEATVVIPASLQTSIEAHPHASIYSSFNPAPAHDRMIHLSLLLSRSRLCQVIVDDDLPGIIGFVNEEIKVEDPVVDEGKDYKRPGGPKTLLLLSSWCLCGYIVIRIQPVNLLGEPAETTS